MGIFGLTAAALAGALAYFYNENKEKADLFIELGKRILETKDEEEKDLVVEPKVYGKWMDEVAADEGYSHELISIDSLDLAKSG